MVPTFRKFSNLIALPHSVFALPFALVSFLMASRKGILISPQLGLLGSLLMVVICLVCARTAAMAFNRLVDGRIDALNPRTAQREIPSGAVSQRNSFYLVIGASTVFFLGAAALGGHCLMLAPVVLALLLGYSYAKRFTWCVHFILGLCLAAAAGGAWWVLRPVVEVEPIVLMLGVLLWVSGFDILYSCQDYDFDREHQLYSVPARFGIAKALQIAFTTHVLAVACFFGFGVVSNLSAPYFYGVAALCAVFLGQHWLISPTNLSRVNHAFFTYNGLISLSYFLLTASAL